MARAGEGGRPHISPAIDKKYNDVMKSMCKQIQAIRGANLHDGSFETIGGGATQPALAGGAASEAVRNRLHVSTCA